MNTAPGQSVWLYGRVRCLACKTTMPACWPVPSQAVIPHAAPDHYLQCAACGEPLAWPCEAAQIIEPDDDTVYYAAQDEVRALERQRIRH